MRTTAVVSLKGGAGKTTVCLALAYGSPEPNRAVIIDLDPQASSEAVRKMADENGDGPGVVAIKPDLLPRVLASASQLEATFCLIDTPPSADKAMRAAIAAAEFVLLVARPLPLDLIRLPQALEAVRAAGKRHAIVLNARPAHGQRELNEAIAYVEQLGAPLAPGLGYRVGFQRLSLGQRLDGQARDEAAALFDYLTTQLQNNTTT